VLGSSLEQCRRDLERERKRGEAALASASERHAKDIEVHEKLQGAQERRAIAAEATCAVVQKEAEAEREKATSLQGKVMLLASKVQQLESDLEAATAGFSEAEVASLRGQLDGLQAENAHLSHRAATLMERYGRGELVGRGLPTLTLPLTPFKGDAEKELVNYVVSLTESSNEQLLIEKENEIRSVIDFPSRLVCSTLNLRLEG
jgi:chromosome segregation ATPase